MKDLEKQLVLWHTADEVRSGLLTVDPGAAVLIDEAQTISRSKERFEPGDPAVVGNASASWQRHRADGPAVWTIDARGDAAGGSDHEVSAVRSIRAEKSLSGAGTKGIPKKPKSSGCFPGNTRRPCTSTMPVIRTRPFENRERGATIMRKSDDYARGIRVSQVRCIRQFGSMGHPPKAAKVTPSTVAGIAPPVAQK